MRPTGQADVPLELERREQRPNVIAAPEQAIEARYAQPKSTVDTVFGIIQRVQGYRQFLLLGLNAVQDE